MEKRQATAGERKAASSAILAAAAVKQEKDQVVIWSQENFDRHLEKLTIDEVKVLLELVLTQKKQSVFLYEPNIGAAQFRQTGFNFKTNQGRVISRLLAILAE